MTITGLKPDRYYIIRVIAQNPAGFHAASDPIRVRTKPAGSGDFFGLTPGSGQDSHQDAAGDAALPIVQPCKGFVASVGTTASSGAGTKDNGGSMSTAKRASIARRVSSLASESDQHDIDAAGGSYDGDGTVLQLTSRLDTLRQESEDIERLLSDENTEFESMKAALTKKNNELRQELKRRDTESREQKRRIAELEKEDVYAQQKRAAQEKILHEKVNSHKRLKEHVVLWDREEEQYKAETERIVTEKAQDRMQTDEKIQELQNLQAEHIQATKRLEEQIRTIGKSMEELKETKRRFDDSETAVDGRSGFDTGFVEEEKQWDERLKDLHARYTAAWTGLQQAQTMYHQAQQRLEYINQRRSSQPHIFPPSPVTDDTPDRRSTLRRRRTGSIRQDPSYTSSATFGVPGHTFNSSTSSASPTVHIPPSSSVPISMFGVSKMPGQSTTQHVTLSAAERHALTGGAPMSPTEGNLLPAGLLGDESGNGIDDVEAAVVGADRSSMHNRNSGIFPGLGAPIPGLGAFSFADQAAQGPNSPISMASRSPSIFSSPRNSAGHLPFPTSDAATESDRRSIQSASGSSRGLGGGFVIGSGGTRFGNIFGLSRQRGKTLPHEGPVLGSLKGVQSHSMPRSDHAKLDPIGTRGRRGSHSGTWVDQMSSVLSRNSKSAEETATVVTKDSAPRKRTFNMFGSKQDPWSPSGPTAMEDDAETSPRPGSQSSTDNYILPRPSSESQQRFGWPIGSFEHRNNSLGTEWPLNTSAPWSQQHSRRQSATGPFAPLLERQRQDLSAGQDSPSQVPIGTRPGKFKQSLAPTLNPAAPHFKSIFIRDKKGDKGDKGDKSSDKERDRGKGKEKRSEGHRSEPIINVSLEGSPSEPRRSRDGLSVSTNADTSDSRASLDDAQSATPSDTLTPSASTAGLASKETFMQKLSRKSSSGKFNFPGFSKNKEGLFAGMKKERAPSNSGDAGEFDEDEDSVADLRRSFESGTASTPVGSTKSSALSWSSLKRMGKKGDKAPSVSESGTSETGDEEE